MTSTVPHLARAFQRVFRVTSLTRHLLPASLSSDDFLKDDKAHSEEWCPDDCYPCKLGQCPNEKKRKAEQNSRETTSKLISSVHDSITKKDDPSEGEKLVCLFDESPYYILKVAAQGNLNEVKRLHKDDPTRIDVTDYRGQNIVHHAATWSRIQVLDWLMSILTDGLQKETLINGLDKLLNSPLHLAIEKNQVEAVKWLLTNKASMYVKNIRNYAPIHYAIDQDKIEMVRLILDHNPWTISLLGDMGGTPLHVACTRGLPHIARLLLERGADVTKRSEAGCPPIQSACKAAASDVIDVLVEFAEKQGISAKSLINMVDKDKLSPLQSAVISGDIKAVRVCLKAGSDIDEQQVQDRQTAVHNAAAQGATDLIALMFEMQPEKKAECLHLRDILEQTALHKAAQFNHVTVVEQLIDEGASINAQDGERRTPLLLAAAKDAVGVVNVLLRKRANVSIRDKDNRNFLHIAVLNGTRISDIELNQLKNLQLLLNERDDFGSTPIHYASQNGQLSTLNSLMQLGANLTLKDSTKRNSLHLAAKHGRFKTCKQILMGEDGILLLNEADSEGRTPLLVAAAHGHVKIITLLFRRGALITKDYQQNTPLHLAAENGHYEAVVVLANLAPHHLNAQNKIKNTALHLAALGGYGSIVDYLLNEGAEIKLNDDKATFADVATMKYQCEVWAVLMKHPRREEVLSTRSWIYGTPFIGLIQNLPRAALMFMDDCVKYGPGDRQAEEFYIEYDYRYMQTPCYLSKHYKGEIPKQPMNIMVQYNRLQMLMHPLSLSFLQDKWNRFGMHVFNIRMVLTAALTVLLTSLAIVMNDMTDVVVHPRNNSSSSNQSNFSEPLIIPSDYDGIDDKPADFSLEDGSAILVMRPYTASFIALIGLVMTFNILNTIWSSCAIYHQKLVYFFYLANWLEWTLLILTYATVLPLFCEGLFAVRPQLMLSAMSMFLSWINIFMQLRYRNVGIHVVMFGQTFKTLMITDAVFSIIGVGFAIALKMTFRTFDGVIEQFRTVPIAFMTGLVMLTGELNYSDIISPTLDGSRTFTYGVLPYLIFLLFLLLIPTLLKNLLIGMAVGDIETIRKHARLERLSMKVELFTWLEAKLPKGLLRGRMPLTGKHYPMRCKKKWGWGVSFAESIIKDEGFDDLLDDANSNKKDESWASGKYKNEIAMMFDEVTRRTKQLSNMSSKMEAQQAMIRTMIKKIDENKHDQFVMELSEDDDDDGEVEDSAAYRKKHHRRNSTEYHSPGTSFAQWSSVSNRIVSNVRKTKNKNIWHSSPSPTALNRVLVAVGSRRTSTTSASSSAGSLRNQSIAE